MKYLKIHVLQDKGQMIYPQNYQYEIGDYSKDHLYFEDEKGECYLLLTIEDNDFKQSMIKDRVNEISEVDLKAISEANEVRTEKITDEAKVRRLEIKSRLGMTLTSDELKALDPNDPTPGIEIGDILADRVEKLKIKENAKINAK